MLNSLLIRSIIVLIVFSFFGCNVQEKAIVKKGFTNAEAQTRYMLKLMEGQKDNRLPKSVSPDGQLGTSGIYDWTSGFFPGILWYLYEYSNDENWEMEARKWTALLEPVKDFYGHHDVGFMINSSFGNGYKLTKDTKYKEVIIQAARSLSKRYNPKTGVILSWDADKGWQSRRGWKYPVIIDNMINLELLFKATKLSGDSSFYKIAVSHADRTLENHFRPDYSSYHVVDYDPETGKVRNKHTAQGYSHESAWARGQAWGLYGFTFCYRETRDKRYLDLAQHIADFILNNPKLPKDMIPYWDFSDPKIPNTYRDASAAAVIASGLLQLAVFADTNKAAVYRRAAEKILVSLSSEKYLAKPGTNNGFLLRHSVGSIPHNNEIDVPLVYADYYYLEALLQYKGLKAQQ